MCKRKSTDNRTRPNLKRKVMEPVYILGGGRTDFKRNLKKEGKTIRHLIAEAGKKALDDAKTDPAEIQAAAVGNFNAGQFTKQLHLGAFIPEIDPKLHGIPTMHTEAACASGAAGANARGRSHLRLCVAGLGQKPECRSALEGVGLFADHRRRCFPRVSFGQISGSNRS